MEADTDRDGKISFEEFQKMVENTDVSMSMTLGAAPYSIPILQLFSCASSYFCAWTIKSGIAAEMLTATTDQF